VSAQGSAGLLVDALRRPADLADLPPDRWSELVREARKADLLGRLAARLDAAGIAERIPAAPRLHLESAQLLALAQHAEVRREVGRLLRLLQPLGIPLVLLKGAAYVYSQVPAAQGRMFSDIDILVPRESLPAVEATLMLEGWATTHHSAYDQHYYRKWMHELPPLRHIRRGTVLDVHHAILPETARLRPDSARLWQSIAPIERAPGLYVLDPVDMVLHSMTHLLCNEEFSHGLRDLSDIDLLLRHFGQDPGFWRRLPARARELGLGRLLYHGLRQAQSLLHTPVPPEVAGEAARFGPRGFVGPLMDFLWHRALGGKPAGNSGVLGGIPGFALFVRAHWLRMPAWLLAGHIVVKSFARGA
jgi:hypothetical protein